MTDRFWMGPIPAACDTCDMEITNKFYDAKTSEGPWANMCPTCFNFGPGLGRLGTGLGQEYTQQANKFKKTGG